MIFTYCILCLCVAIVLISTFVRNVRARRNRGERLERERDGRDEP